MKKLNVILFILLSIFLGGCKNKSTVIDENLNKDVYNFSSEVIAKISSGDDQLSFFIFSDGKIFFYQPVSYVGDAKKVFIYDNETGVLEEYTLNVEGFFSFLGCGITSDKCIYKDDMKLISISSSGDMEELVFTEGTSLFTYISKETIIIRENTLDPETYFTSNVYYVYSFDFVKDMEYVLDLPSKYLYMSEAVDYLGEDMILVTIIEEGISTIYKAVDGKLEMIFSNIDGRLEKLVQLNEDFYVLSLSVYVSENSSSDIIHFYEDGELIDSFYGRISSDLEIDGYLCLDISIGPTGS